MSGIRKSRSENAVGLLIKDRARLAMIVACAADPNCTALSVTLGDGRSVRLRRSAPGEKAAQISVLSRLIVIAKRRS